MRPFNLTEAIAGNPVRLVDGTKAYIFQDVRDLVADEPFPLIGGYVYDVVRYSDGRKYSRFEECRWAVDCQCGRLNYLGNIAGMWEE